MPKQLRADFKSVQFEQLFWSENLFGLSPDLKLQDFDLLNENHISELRELLDKHVPSDVKTIHRYFFKTNGIHYLLEKIDNANHRLHLNELLVLLKIVAQKILKPCWESMLRDNSKTNAQTVFHDCMNMVRRDLSLFTKSVIMKSFWTVVIDTNSPVDAFGDVILALLLDRKDKKSNDNLQILASVLSQSASFRAFVLKPDDYGRTHFTSTILPTYLETKNIDLVQAILYAVREETFRMLKEDRFFILKCSWNLFSHERNESNKKELFSRLFEDAVLTCQATDPAFVQDMISLHFDKIVQCKRLLEQPETLELVFCQNESAALSRVSALCQSSVAEDIKIRILEKIWIRDVLPCLESQPQKAREFIDEILDFANLERWYYNNHSSLVCALILRLEQFSPVLLAHLWVICSTSEQKIRDWGPLCRNVRQILSHIPAGNEQLTSLVGGLIDQQIKYGLPVVFRVAYGEKCILDDYLKIVCLHIVNSPEQQLALLQALNEQVKPVRAMSAEQRLQRENRLKMISQTSHHLLEYACFIPCGRAQEFHHDFLYCLQAGQPEQVDALAQCYPDALIAVIHESGQSFLTKAANTVLGYFVKKSPVSIASLEPLSTEEAKIAAKCQAFQQEEPPLPANPYYHPDLTSSSAESSSTPPPIVERVQEGMDTSRYVEVEATLVVYPDVPTNIVQARVIREEPEDSSPQRACLPG